MNKIIGGIKNNKALKIIGNIIYIILFLIMLLLLVVVVLQRTSNNGLSLGGFRLFSVATGSMLPKYEVGDILLSKEINPKEIKVGDDVVYKGKEGEFQGRVVTHQVIEINDSNNEYKFTTKGISNSTEDPEIDENQVIGKIVYKFQILSILAKLTRNIYVFYFLIFIPIALIIFKQIMNIVNNKDDEDDEDDR